MYKKISHNILEEHFDNPAFMPTYTPTFNLGKPGDNFIRAGNGSLSINDPLPYYVMNENTMQFRMDARSAWSKWAYSLMNYAVSLNGNLPGTDQVKGRMNKNAIAVGDFMIPYYGLTAARAVSTALIAISDVGMHYVEAMKNGKPTEEIIKSWEPYINGIAKLLNELNPNNWPETLMRDIFFNLVKAWQDQLTARAKGDIINDEIAIDYINKLVVTGIPDHNKAGYSSLADLFSRGIIAQFPAMFTA